MPNDLIQRALADQPLLRHIAQAVESRAGESEEVALELVPASDAAEATAMGDVVGAKEDADATDGDEDAGELGGVVADVEEEGGDEDDDDDGPEVYELRGEDGGVAVGEDGEVVAEDVKEGEDDVAPG